MASLLSLEISLMGSNVTRSGGVWHTESDCSALAVEVLDNTCTS